MSAARPGRTHDITAARHDHIVEHLKAAGRAPRRARPRAPEDLAHPHQTPHEPRPRH
ncbi:hypothetical protein ABT186_17275 [Streptomyces sp. NPDC001634]|uniref:hypothetical protein n=1 Tax=Streptomyces sp. NPDC001634 TaxID=3154390 RepID=UPI00332ED0EB